MEKLSLQEKLNLDFKMKVIKPKKTCYMCDEVATSKEHVPAKCIFPENIMGINFRENLITVPSCARHNSQKSDDDEFFRNSIAGVYGNNAIGLYHNRKTVSKSLSGKGGMKSIMDDAKLINYIDPKTGKTYEVYTGGLKTERMQKYLDSVGRALYFHFNKTKLTGRVIAQFGFLQRKENNIIDFLKAKFEKEHNHLRKIGSNRSVFYYQVVPPDRFGLMLFKLVFFGGTDFYLAIIPEESEKLVSEDLVMKIFSAGSRRFITYEGVQYEV